MGRAEAHVAFPFSGAVWNIAHMLANARTTALYNQNNLSSPSDYPGARIFVCFVGIQCRLSRQIFAKFLAYLKKLLYHCSEFNPKVVVIATIFVVRNMLWQNTTDKTIKGYLTYLEDAYLISEAERYDVKGKRYFENIKKYYAMESWLAKCAS